MADRHIEAIEHKGTVYVSLDDMQQWVASLVDKTGGATAKDLLFHVLSQLGTIREQRGVR